MDKNAIKKYAVWARKELIERVSQRAAIYGITDEDHRDPNAASVGGRLLSEAEKKQREALIRNIKDKGYDQVIEEVAYTWFNRFSALRFMEVNGYLPSHVRVFTNDEGEFKPQILTEAIHLDLKGLNMDKVYELENANKTEELFKYLLIVQCNALNEILPGMFQRIDDYTELLLPDNLLREGSVIEKMVSSIPESDWTDQVQIIGWLYQYYNTELKDKVFADLKKNIKITKENIPAATQLFTPDWIVHYMVENSLGRLWLEGHPNDELRSEWKYYLDEAEQEPEVQAQLAEIRKEYAALKPEEIRVIDPCMGSGHILCVLFDVLVRIYEDCGYSAREAVVKIIENNLWGLDIDERAGQLAYFAVMMKARQYDRRFLMKKDENGNPDIPQPHVYAIHETDALVGSYKQAMGDFLLSKEHQETLNYLMDVFINAKEYGSILKLEDRDYAGLKDAWGLTGSQTAGTVNMTLWYAAVSPEIPHLIEQAIALSQKYHVVVSNPPYMGSGGMSASLSSFVKKNYKDSKSDMFACFLDRGFSMTKNTCNMSMITMESWMFLSSFENMRKSFLEKYTIYNMVHMPYLGKGGTSLGINFGTSATVFRKCNIDNYRAQYDYICYYDLDSNGTPISFPIINDRYVTSTIKKIRKIPGEPIAYWLSDAFINAFKRKSIGDEYIPKFGMSTGDGELFIRFWFESNLNDIEFCNKNESDADNSNKKWVPLDKGGAYRRWYGNQNCIVWWKNNGADIRKHPKSAVRSPQFFFQEHASWTLMTTGIFSARFFPEGFTIDTASNCLYFKGDTSYEVIGFLNSKVAAAILGILNPTINFSCGVISLLPFGIKNEGICDMVKENIAISKEDWDSFETSWNFTKHPLLKKVDLISKAFEKWKALCDQRFKLLKENEKKINEYFVDQFNLKEEISIETKDNEISIYLANKEEDIKGFISYAVGCILGRYSLDILGIAYAGGEWDASKYTTFQPDKDAIIPICDDEYFEDDIVGRFIKFVETVYGKETLEENLSFIANALGGRGAARDVIRNYFINDFYPDHLKVYQKRPIYWLFDSGKKNGFKCLVYMHRYQPDTIARIRTDYVHEQQSRYRTEIADLEQRINGASSSERVKLNKQLSKLQNQATEIREYEEKIHHLADQMIDIDLDDGVKHNYEIFKDVLAKIK